jgi:hypothetical protein
VLEAVQVMRQRAQAAGNLQSSPQEQMSYDQGAIELAPPSPEYVYVPVYNPWMVYGDPVTPYPGFSLIGALGSFFGSVLGPGLLHFGPGIAMAAFEHTPFGLLSWAVNWLGHEIFFNHSGYSSHSTTVADWGIRGGGMRAFAAHGAGGWSDGGSRVASAQGYARPAPVERSYAPVDRYNRPEQQGYNRPAVQVYNQPRMEAYNRAPAPVSRPQAYSAPENRLAYGPSYYNGGANNSGGPRGFTAPAQPYRAPTQQAYRGPSESFGRGDFGRGSESFKAEKEPKSGGFHPFGGGGGSSYKQPSYKEPKYSAPKFKEPKMAGGKSFGGGHSSSHSSGKHHG